MDNVEEIESKRYNFAILFNNEFILLLFPKIGDDLHAVAAKLIYFVKLHQSSHQAAEIRGEQIVLDRFSKAETLGVPVFYHMDNQCYKSFTLKRKLDEATRKRKREEGQ